MAEATPGPNDAVDGRSRSPAADDAMVHVPPYTGSAFHASPTLPRAYLASELEEAELLLEYAAEAGIPVDDQLRRDVLTAKLANESAWTVDAAARVLDAQTKLTLLLKPVSGESLRKCVHSAEATATLKSHRKMAIVLGLLIVPISVAAFVASVTCETIRKDIDVANGLAVTLVEKVSFPSASPQAGAGAAQPHSEDLKTLQLFASTVRDIEARANRLTVFDLHHEPSRNAHGYQLPAPVTDFSQTVQDAIVVYQRVRSFAQSVQESVSTTFGAVTACILPALYALLGACAYLLRLFESQIKARTFTGREKPPAHFLVAGICGFVVGLFGDFGSGQSAVLPPLALAFLFGYGVDMFFVFLDRLVQTFGRAQPSPAAERAKPS